MFCTQCGQEVSEEKNFCPHCGHSMSVIKVDSVNEISATQSATTPAKLPGTFSSTSGIDQHNSVTTDELATFVGPRAERYQKRWKKIDPAKKLLRPSWNWPAFFFTMFWLSYRKMYWYAAGWSLAFLIASTIDKSFMLAGPIILGVFSNAWYYRYARRKIQKIKSSISEPTAQLSAIQKAGGTSLVAMFISIVLYVGLAAAVTYFLP